MADHRFCFSILTSHEGFVQRVVRPFRKRFWLVGETVSCPRSLVLLALESICCSGISSTSLRVHLGLMACSSQTCLASPGAVADAARRRPRQGLAARRRQKRLPR